MPLRRWHLLLGLLLHGFESPEWHQRKWTLGRPPAQKVSVDDQLKIAELRLDKKKKKKKKIVPDPLQDNDTSNKMLML